MAKAKEKLNYLDMSTEDLVNRLRGVTEDLESAQLKLRIGQFKKTSDFSRLRKERARIMTFLRQKEQKV